ncbi:hypothetical protein GHK51_26905 [Sinorhizobium meliloti]|uniref:hypothetical protein n=1 Tax=Rhizobium meliloti TaxID=382 RepID=UPI001294A5AD|nr:hypothetical protein [Sinorhizobium meliloti]MQW13834.1 hypothetical protein [Sinorhizobium meliloti]
MNKSKFTEAQIALICGKTGGSGVPEVCRKALVAAVILSTRAARVSGAATVSAG